MCKLENQGRSDDGLADAAGLRVDAERVVEGPLIGFGLGGRAHVQRAPVGAAEGGGDALLAFEDAAQRGPTGVFTVGAQPGADNLHELIGDDGDEQVAVGPSRFLVVDGTQAELGLERAEDSLDVGERGVGAPEGVFVPVGLAAAQAETPGWVAIEPSWGRRVQVTATARSPASSAVTLIW